MKAIQRLTASGLTYSQIAKALGITPHAVRFWANGARSPGHENRQRLIELAEARGILLLGSDFSKPKNLPHHTPPARVPNGEHPVRDANDRDHVLGAGRSK